MGVGGVIGFELVGWGDCLVVVRVVVVGGGGLVFVGDFVVVEDEVRGLGYGVRGFGMGGEGWLSWGWGFVCCFGWGWGCLEEFGRGELVGVGRGLEVVLRVVVFFDIGLWGGFF